MPAAIAQRYQNLVWKELTKSGAVSPSAAALCEYLFKKYSGSVCGHDPTSAADNPIGSSCKQPRSCLELSTATTMDVGIVGMYAAATFQIPVATVATVPSTKCLDAVIDGSKISNDHDWIEKKINNHTHLLDTNAKTNIVETLDWDDEEQVHQVARLASPLSSPNKVNAYDWILVASSDITNTSLCHQPLADIIAALMRKNQPQSTILPLRPNAKCFIAHQECGSFNLRGYDYKLAELERALLRAGLFTADVSHHQQQQQQQPVDTAKSHKTLGRRRKALSSKPAIPQHKKLSNRVCILEIEHTNHNQHDATERRGSGTALWRAM